jgi:biopolymer transport protein TolR
MVQLEVNSMSTPKINVTPLIDVLLVLLIIFMVVAPLKPASFQTKVPKAPNISRHIESDPRSLVVTIDSHLKLSLNKDAGLGTVDDPAPMMAKLKSAFEQREANGVLDDRGKVLKILFIKAPKNIGYGNVVKVIDAVKTAGAEPIALQIDYLE